MASIIDILGTSTPVSETLAQKLGYMKAAIACRVFFYQQLKNGVCHATVGTIAEKLGMSPGAVSTNLKWLRDNGYIRVIGEHKKGNSPNNYIVTDKFYNAVEHSSNESEHSADESNIQQMNGEEEVKEKSPLYNSNPPKKPKTKWENAGPVASSVIKITKLKPSAIVNGTELDLKNVLRFLQAENIESDHVLKFAKWYGQTPTLKAITDNWGRFEAGELPPHKQYAKNKQYPKDNANGNQNPTAIKLTPEEKQRADELNRQFKAAATKGI